MKTTNTTNSFPLALYVLTLTLVSNVAFAQSGPPGQALINFAVPLVAALTVISAIIGIAAMAFGNEAGKRVLMGSGAGVIAVLLMKSYVTLVQAAQSN